MSFYLNICTEFKISKTPGKWLKIEWQDVLTDTCIQLKLKRLRNSMEFTICSDIFSTVFNSKRQFLLIDKESEKELYVGTESSPVVF